MVFTKEIDYLDKYQKRIFYLNEIRRMEHEEYEKQIKNILDFIEKSDYEVGEYGLGSIIFILPKKDPNSITRTYELAEDVLNEEEYVLYALYDNDYDFINTYKYFEMMLEKDKFMKQFE